MKNHSLKGRNFTWQRYHFKLASGSNSAMYWTLEGVEKHLTVCRPKLWRPKWRNTQRPKCFLEFPTSTWSCCGWTEKNKGVPDVYEMRDCFSQTKEGDAITKVASLLRKVAACIFNAHVLSHLSLKHFSLLELSPQSQALCVQGSTVPCWQVSAPTLTD